MKALDKELRIKIRSLLDSTFFGSKMHECLSLKHQFIVLDITEILGELLIYVPMCSNVR